VDRPAREEVPDPLDPAPAVRVALGPDQRSVTGSVSGAGRCAMNTMGAAVADVADVADALQQVHPWVAEGARRVRFGVIATGLGDWGAARACAQAVEGLGFDSLWTGDHPAFGTAGWPTLGALAQATRTLRLGTLVSCVAYWNPVVLATLAADVDRLSGGRFVLGLGSGDMAPEFAQLGLAWPPGPARQAVLEDALRIVRPLLRGEAVSYQGEHSRARGVSPRPVAQRPYLPLLVAGGGERTTLRFAARYADASNLGAASWAGGAFTPADARRKLAALRRHCAEAGRPAGAVLPTAVVALFLGASPEAARAKLDGFPPALRAFAERLPVVGTPEEVALALRALVGAGFRYLICLLPATDTEALELLARRVVPAVVAG
jgi:alkanesulfonate monooxygenase SsuD/methylene tetrahydromethanopterin reductase-like flavin-dependent oxidoreductase (luciferase family)